MARRETQVGDLVRCRDGTVCMVVDRFQKAQTRGYWINNVPFPVRPSYAPGRVDNMWLLDPVGFGSNRSLVAAFKNKGDLCLCILSEVDPGYPTPEKNEYGEVCP